MALKLTHPTCYQALSLLLQVSFISAKEVLQLDHQNFNNVVQEHKIVLIAFTTSWCRYSQALMPIWQQLSMTTDEEPFKDVVIATADCDREVELSAMHNIIKYPTIMAYRDGRLLTKEYRGSRNLLYFRDYLTQLLAPAAVEVPNTMNFFANLGKERKEFFGVFASREDHNLLNYAKTAESFRDYCHFKYTILDPKNTTGVESIDHMPPLEVNTIMFASKSGNLTKMPFQADASNNVTIGRAEMSIWIEEQCRPLVDEITFNNGEEMTEEGLPFFILFSAAHDRDSREKFIEAVTKHVRHERGRIKFLLADGNIFAHPLRHMGKEPDDLPVVAIDDFKHMYDFGPVSRLNDPGSMQKSIDDLFSGALHRNFHSQ
eukprot:Ihof_evm2s555 gene=Ihof_evmTU2s555